MRAEAVMKRHELRAVEAPEEAPTPHKSVRRGERPDVRPADHWRDADELRWSARHWAARLGVRTPAIHIRPMTTKWGSLSRTITHANPDYAATTITPYAGRLTLNSDLLTLPRDLGEFVIVHELVHLLAPNHGRVFKSFLHAYLPDWRDRERRLALFSQR